MKGTTLAVGLFVLLTAFLNTNYASAEQGTNLSPVNYTDVHHYGKHRYNRGYSRYAPRFYHYFKPRRYGYSRYKNRGYGRHNYGYRNRHYRYR